jgi:hypothetical protein
MKCLQPKTSENQEHLKKREREREKKQIKVCKQKKKEL